MIFPNPIRLAILSAALGAGIAMIAIGALKGAQDIVEEARAEREAEATEEEAVVEVVAEEPADTPGE